MRNFCYSIIFDYYITKPNISFLRYILNIVYSAKYVPTVTIIILHYEKYCIVLFFSKIFYLSAVFEKNTDIYTRVLKLLTNVMRILNLYQFLF